MRCIHVVTPWIWWWAAEIFMGILTKYEFNCNICNEKEIEDICLFWGEYQMSHLITKPTKWHVRPAKTQISLGIRPVLLVLSWGGSNIFHRMCWKYQLFHECVLMIFSIHEMKYFWYLPKNFFFLLFLFYSRKADCFNNNFFLAISRPFPLVQRI